MSNGNPIDTNADNSSSFKYKSFFKALTAADNGGFKIVKNAVPQKYFDLFLEIFRNAFD